MGIRIAVRRALVVAGALAFTLSLSRELARAQDSATTGVPDGLAAGFEAPLLRADAYALSANPANLSFVDGAHTAILWNRMAGQTDDVAGVGLYQAFGTDGGFGVGVGFDRLFEPGALIGRLAASAGSQRVAVGIGMRGYHSRTDRELDGWRTADVFLSGRASNAFGFGLGVRNLGTPRLRGATVPRVWSTSLAFREASGLVETELIYRGAEAAWGDGDVEAVVVGRLVRGLRLYASFAYDLEAGEPARAGGGLELTLGPTISSAAVHAPLSGDDDLRAVAAIEFAWPEAANGVGRRGFFLRLDVTGDFDESPGHRIFGDDGTAFTDLLVDLDRVREDRAFDGVFLNLSGASAGWGQLYELRTALDAIRESGKQVVVYIEHGTIRDLYLAAGADWVAGPPTLSVLSTGVVSRRFYIAELLESVGVEAMFVRIGDYKSGPERFTQNAPSPESAEQLTRFLDRVWTDIGSRLGAAWDLEPAAVGDRLDSAPLSADELVEHGVMDAVVYRDELGEAVEEWLGRPFRVTYDPDVRPTRSPYWIAPHRIAVIHIDGAIVSGGSSAGLFGTTTGSATIGAIAEQLAADPGVEGVIVRIDSPGGSATASDQIHRALSRLAEAKPTVVSMGDVAASGGMYVAAIGAPIHATPNTLTGSIGIYAGSFSLDELFSWLGVNRVRDERGGPGRLFDGHGWSDEERSAVYDHIEQGYEIFVDRVATSRGLTTDEVDAIGQGRIWGGGEAVEVGLVDEAGGFLVALHALRARLGLRDGAPVTLEHHPSPSFSLMGLLPELPRFRARQGSDLANRVSDVLAALGLSSAVEALGVLTSAPSGTPMAHLEWVLDGL